MLFLRFLVNFGKQIINLSFSGANLNFRIQKAGRTDNLFCTKQFMLLFVLSWSCGNKEHLIDFPLKLGKIQRTVIKGGGKTETEVDKSVLSGKISVVHPSNLGKTDVAFIHNNQEVVRKVVNQGVGRFTWRCKIQMPGIVFDAGADTGFPNHFHIEVCALGNALCFQKLVFFFKILYPFLQFRKNIFAGQTELVHGNNIGTGRENHGVFQFFLRFAAQDINKLDFLDFITEENHANGLFPFGGRENVNRITLYAETSSSKVHIVSRILNFNEISE